MVGLCLLLTNSRSVTLPGLVRPPDYIILKPTTEEQLDQQQKFLFDVISQLEDCICDAEFDLGSDSVLYQKLKDLLDTVETYQENL
jgi:hypothetical protein